MTSEVLRRKSQSQTLGGSQVCKFDFFAAARVHAAKDEKREALGRIIFTSLF
jgi:hypothetical protein